MYPYGKESFTQGSVLLYLKTEAEPVAETSCFFHSDGRKSPKKRDYANITFTLYIYALHEIEFLTDASVLQGTSRHHVPVTAT
jgi:hypothetical protein